MANDVLVLAVTCPVLWGLWYLYDRSVTKSAIKGLPGPPSQSFITGNLKQIFSYDGMSFHHMLPLRYGGVVQINALFGDQQLYISDPRALHHILVKDQYVFEETSGFIASNRVIFGAGLLSSLGEQHRQQRKMLNPVFSPGHMRALVPIFYDLTEQLRDVLARKVQSGEEEIDMLKWMSRAALEFVGVGGLGYSFQALDENVENVYGTATKQLLPALFTLLPFRPLWTLADQTLPLWLRRIIVRHLPLKRVKKIRAIVDIMHNKSLEVYNKKKEALLAGDGAIGSQVGDGKDIMSTLLRANMAAAEKDRLSEDELLGQMNTLIFAAHDTTSSALSRILYMLSNDQERQERLRKEVTEARAEYGNLDYDKLMGLPYLDAICRETLRLHAPSTVQQRTARKDISIPLSWPVTLTNGQTINELPVRDNQTVLVSIAGTNRSPLIWGEDAAEWRPERWLEPLPDSVAAAKVPGVYSNLLTFIGGGRACIGFKFSELEMKVILSVLVENFVFSPSKDEIVWRLSAVQIPCVKGREGDPPHMPMRLALAKRS
ncbi:cytochrome P450 [Punctularia strigosozonata HHB-11173 SS5]|uniref:cytochrome P450 n=1 Tax=Punctularia strigosozonata (strain HHB-11173) TaxID=741275 RepID=UPI0004417514|nr:cytochrome P450 [Punctularia strigosozonata HHB-11173 SS5]EIN05404.1 cytochrome P450 [Punctularia strigosozonata HHB-11173 SS5]